MTSVRFQKGEIPYTGLVAFPSDPSLHETAVRAVKEAAPSVHVFEGRICSGDQFIASSAARKTIISQFGGLCCEMEGAAVAQACHLNGVPWVIIRAISDKADDSEEMSFEEFAAAAAQNCAAAVRHMISG